MHYYAHNPPNVPLTSIYHEYSFDECNLFFAKEISGSKGALHHKDVDDENNKVTKAKELLLGGDIDK